MTTKIGEERRAARAIERLEARSARRRGGGRARAAGDAAHGDYATNVAMRLAGVRKQPPRAIAGGARRAGDRAPRRRARRDRRPGLRQPLAHARLVPRRARRAARRRRRLRRRLGRDEGAHPGRAGLGQPDRADHGRGGPQRRLRRLGGAAARLRRARGRARVLLQRRGRADDALPRLGRGAPARGGAARGRLPGRLHRRARAAAGRPGAADAAADRGDARALPDPLRLLGAAERARAAAARVPAAAGHLREGRRPLGPLVRPRRRRRPRPRSAPRPARRPTAPRTSSTSPTSSTAASTARSTCSAPTTTARATGTRRSPGCSATTRRASRCCIYQLVHLTRGGEAAKMSKRRGDVVFLDELPRRGRGRRRPLVPRLARPRPDDRDRRRPGGREEPEEPGLLRPVRARPHRRDPPQRRRGAPSAEPPAELAAEERDLVKRLAEFPAVVAEATERPRPARDPDLRDPGRRRLPPLLHAPQGARLRRGGVPARPRHGDEAVIARSLDLIGVEAPERM